MAIDYDAMLIYGWKVDGKLLIELLIQGQIGTCDGWYVKDDETGKVTITTSDPTKPSAEKKSKREVGTQCFCGPSHCWANAAKVLPKGVTIIQTGNDQFGNDFDYYVSLVPAEIENETDDDKKMKDKDAETETWYDSKDKRRFKVTLDVLNAIPQSVVEEAKAFAQKCSKKPLGQPRCMAAIHVS